MKRVLIVNRVGFLGGVERTILTLAGGLDAFGWQPILASPAVGALPEAASAQGTLLAPCEFDRMRITANPRILLRYPLAWKYGAASIERACRLHGVHVLHVHHPVTALYALRAQWQLRLPVVLHVHEMLPARPLYALALRAVVRRVTRLVCVSRAALNLALANGADPSRTEVVPNGIDVRFTANLGDAPAPAMVRAAGPGPHIGVFGVLEPRKAQHVFLEAAALIAARFPDARFWLIGPAALKDKQAYAARLQHLIEAGPLQGRVAMVGFQADVASWLAAMDIVVQPSAEMESFGMAAAEALMLGRAVVVSDVGGLPDVVRDQVTGLVVPAGDPAALSAALAGLLMFPERRLALGQRGAADARERFAPERFQRSIADVYAAATGAAQ